MQIKLSQPKTHKLSLDLFKEKSIGQKNISQDLKGGTITILLSSDTAKCCTPKTDDCHVGPQH